MRDDFTETSENIIYLRFSGATVGKTPETAQELHRSRVPPGKKGN